VHAISGGQVASDAGRIVPRLPPLAAAACCSHRLRAAPPQAAVVAAAVCRQGGSL